MRKLSALGIIAALMAAVVFGTSTPSASKVVEAGGGPYATIETPQQATVGHQSVNLTVKVINASTMTQVFTVLVWHGGPGWSGEDNPYITDLGSVYAFEADSSGAYHHWAGYIAPNATATFKVPTFTGNTLGTFDFARATLWVRGTVMSDVKQQLTIVNTSTPTPTVSPTVTATSTATPQPTNTATPAPKQVIFAISPTSASVETGKTVDLGVHIDTQGQTVNAVEFRVKFDPTVLRFVKSLYPTTGSCGMHDRAWSQTAGQVDFVSMSDQSWRCTLTVLRFEALKSGQTRLTLDKLWTEAIDHEFNMLPVQTSDGQVTTVTPKSAPKISTKMEDPGNDEAPESVGPTW